MRARNKRSTGVSSDDAPLPPTPRPRGWGGNEAETSEGAWLNLVGVLVPDTELYLLLQVPSASSSSLQRIAFGSKS